MFFQYLSLLFQSWHSVCGVRWQLQKERNRTMHEQLYREIEGMQDRLAAWRRVLHQIPEVSMDLPKYPGLCERPAERDGVGYTQAAAAASTPCWAMGTAHPCSSAACGTAVFIFQFVELPIQHCAALAIQISHETRRRYLRWYFLQHVDMVCTYLCFHYPNTFPFA